MSVFARRTAVALVLILVVTFGAVAPAAAVYADDDGRVATGQPTAGQPTANQPTANQPTAERPAAEHDGGPHHVEDHPVDEDERGERDASSEHRNGGDNADDGRPSGTADDGNSSFTIAFEAGGENASARGSFACVGTLLRHECDKGGGFAAGPISLDYDGRNYGDVRGLNGGGGDEFTLAAGNRTATVGFECELRPETLTEGPCSPYANSSEGSPPSPV